MVEAIDRRLLLGWPVTGSAYQIEFWGRPTTPDAGVF